MIKIIDGVRYDTEKAIEVGSAEASCPQSDFHYWSETLYKAPRSGRFFIAGEGGPMSKWSKPVYQNSWRGSSGIRPMNAEQAREWCEQYLEDTDWTEHFPKGAIEDA
jgi:hypothetical protein